MDFVELALAIVTAITTLVLAWIAVVQIMAHERTQRDATRPKIIFYGDYPNSEAVWIVLRNVGPGPALDIVTNVHRGELFTENSLWEAHEGILANTNPEVRYEFPLPSMTVYLDQQTEGRDPRLGNYVCDLEVSYSDTHGAEYESKGSVWIVLGSGDAEDRVDIRHFVFTPPPEPTTRQYRWRRKLLLHT